MKRAGGAERSALDALLQFFVFRRVSRRAIDLNVENTRSLLAIILCNRLMKRVQVMPEDLAEVNLRRHEDERELFSHARRVARFFEIRVDGARARSAC